jgi:hypothetical protein
MGVIRGIQKQKTAEIASRRFHFDAVAQRVFAAKQ